jgi:hypothetical protein
VVLSLRVHLEAPFTWLWNHVGIGTIMFWGGSIFRWLVFNITGKRYYLMLSLPSLLSIFMADVVHRVNPMLRWVFINSLTSLFRLQSTIYSSWLFTHRLSLVFQFPVFYILAITTLCEELGIDKPTLILYLGSLLSCALSGAFVLGMYTATPMLYLSSLSCVQALRVCLSFLFNNAFSGVSILAIHTSTPILYFSFLSCVRAPSDVWSWVFLLSF